MSWIKLNKKATNLPKESCYCWLRVVDFGEQYIMMGQYSETAKGFYGWRDGSTITHYLIIEEPSFP